MSYPTGCSHNNIHDPNLPFEAVGDKLKDWLKDFYNPPRQKPNISINGDKGMYNCDCRDKNGNGIKFKINCEQVPFPQGVVPKPWKVGVFYDPDTNKNERPKSNCRKRRRNDDDQDYIPSAIELQKANNEQMESNKKNKSIPERRVEMYVTPLTEQATKFGKALYDLAQTGHTFVLIKDGENEFVVESNPVVITKEQIKYIVNLDEVNRSSRLTEQNNQMTEYILKANNTSENNNIFNFINNLHCIVHNDTENNEIIIDNIKSVLNDNSIDDKITAIRTILENKEPTTTRLSVTNQVSKIIYKPIFYATQEADNINIEQYTTHNYGIDLHEYVSIVDMFTNLFGFIRELAN